MPLLREHTDWLEKAQGSAATFGAANDTLSAKITELDKITADIANIQDQMQEANDRLEVVFKGKFKPNMKWMTGDRDAEIDTIHDIKGEFDVDEEDLRRVQELHGKLVEMSHKMLDAKDKNNTPVFTPKDVERELWSPLIRADVIPSNAVPDVFSQEAQVFNGACEIYDKKLQTYTETASRNPAIQRGLRLGMDALSVVGTLGGEVAKVARIDESFIPKADALQNEKNELALEEAKKSGDQAQIKSLTAKVDAFKERKDDAKMAAAAAKRDGLIIKGGIALFNGALGAVDTLILERGSVEDKTIKVTDKVFKTIGDAAEHSFAAWAANVSANDLEEAGKADFKTLTMVVGKGIKAGLGGAQIMLRCAEAAKAAFEGDEKALLKVHKALVAVIADTVANSFAMLDKQSGKDDAGESVSGTDGEFAKYGAYVKALILAMGQQQRAAVDFSKTLVDFAQGGGGDWKAMAKIVGLEAFSQSTLIMAGGAAAATPEIGAEFHGTREAGEDFALNKQTEMEAAKRVGSDGSRIGSGAEKMVSLADLARKFPADTDFDALVNKVAAAAERQQAEMRQDALSDFKKSLKDPAIRQAFIDEIAEKSAAEVEELKHLVDAASPLDDLSDPAQADRAMAAIDKLIKQAAAANMKWKVMTGVATGMTSIVASALPVAGLAASITRLATDVAILLKQSYHLNKWRSNIALTYGNSSVYGPAINTRLDSAYVQVHHQSVKVIFDSLGVTADALKLADASGVGAAAGAVGHGIELGNNMARALTEFGYKLHKEAEIELGWQLYKKARDNPGDRKLARKAVRWNSTLSKCVLAYGIVMDGDPIAKEVGRSCGLTPEILADQSDVCGKVVKYFETMYSDDPKVLRRVPLKKDWHPGSPTLTLMSWTRFKAAAMMRATPVLDPKSASAAVDAAFLQLQAVVGGAGDYAMARDTKFKVDENNVFDTTRISDAYGDFVSASQEALANVAKTLKAFQPRNGPCSKDAKDPWDEGAAHEGMAAVVTSLAAQADFALSEARFDLKEYETQTSADDDDMALDTLFG